MTLRIKNIGEVTASVLPLWDPVIVSDANKSYEEVRTYELA